MMSAYEILWEDKITWKYAIIGALVSIPVSIASLLQYGNKISLTGVLIGGLFAGFLAKIWHGSTDLVGVRTGIIGSIPISVIVYEMGTAVSELSNPTWFSTVLIALIGVIGAISLGLSLFLGWIGAKVGDWLATRIIDRDSPT